MTQPEPPPPGWPKGVTPISVETVDRLGLNESGELFWNGRPVEIRKPLILSPLQRLGAAIVVIASIAGALGSLAQGITAAVDFGCARGAWPYFYPAAAKTKP